MGGGRFGGLWLDRARMLPPPDTLGPRSCCIRRIMPLPFRDSRPRLDSRLIDMPLLDLRLVAVVAFALVTPLSATVVAADLPVEVERLHGEVAVIQDQPGETLRAGTQVHTGMDGRAELSMGGAPSLFVGGDSQLLLHSADGDVLRVRLLKGSMRADTRASRGQPRRDLRLNAGDVQLRIADGEVWIEHADGQTQVCSIAGAAEVQVESRRDRLDFPGQCVRRAGVETAWTLVPPEILSARVEQVSLPQASPVAAAQPTVPVPAPAPTPSAAVSQPPSAPSSASQSTAAAPPPPAPEFPEPEIASAESAVAATMPEQPAPMFADADAAPTAAPPPASIEQLSQTLAQAEAIADARNAAVATPASAAGTAAASEIGAEPEPRAKAEVETAPEARIDPSSESAAPADIAVSDIDPVAAAEVEAAAMTAPTHAPSGPSLPLIAATETAAAASEEAVDDGRRWSVVLASMSTQEAADQEVARLRRLGLQPEAREYQVGERNGFRVGMGRYRTREDADAALLELQSAKPALPGWVAKY